MFTGIIRATAKVKKIEAQSGSRFLNITKPTSWQLKAGDSVSINGICSTVKKITPQSFQVEYMPETLKVTTARFWKSGNTVNLELPMRAGDRLDGHFVQGHIDTVGQISDVKNISRSRVLKVTFPKKYRRLIVPKGSIAVDGVSLTIVKTGKNFFTASLVSYTLKNTSLASLKEGDYVNIETDILGRHLFHLLKKDAAR